MPVDRLLVKIDGTGLRRELARYLKDGIEDAGVMVAGVTGSAGQESSAEALEVVSGGEKCVVVLESDRSCRNIKGDFSVFITDSPLERLDTETVSACSEVEVVLIEWGDRFAGESEIGIERKIKGETGARKVLIYHDEESKERNYRKMLDTIFAKIGGNTMSDDIPEEVITAVKEAAEDNRIACGAAQKIAHDLGVPIPLVGRALDRLGIKITKCQLGCF